MADIRIKDLTTEVSSTATGDFFVIDGTTGTRRTPAFNPTFGGNAVVTGTLTVNGTGASSFAGRLAIGASALSDRMFYVSGSTGTTGASQFSAVVNPTIPNTVTTSAYGLYLGTNIAAGATVTNGYSLFIAAPDYTGSTVTNKYGLYSNDPNPSYFVGNVLVGSTTASTTTSTGALVVGNGTSGGLGVGGAANIGGTLTANGTTFNLSTASANGSFINMDGLAGNFKIITTRTGGVDRWYFGQDTAAESGSNAGSPFFIRALTDAGAVIDTPLTITRAAGGRLTTPRPVTISDSTASTSTSSGALVVSGGVGVAKRIHSGEGLTVSADSDTQISFVRNGTVSIGPDSSATPALVVSSAIKTSAPSGGTAANWKLGTVASVSPTSPNRTIEVDIGGTIYYIHAKTTNN